VNGGVKMLFERTPTTERSIAFLTFENVSWGAEILIKSFLAAKRSITLVILIHWGVSWGVQGWLRAC
jgi:hypothetical protein